MSNDIGPTLMVPVSNLMCIDLRMSSLLRENTPIHRKEMPLFLSLLDDVIDRWYTAVGGMNPLIYEQYHIHAKLITDLTECFSKVSDDDSANLFLERQRLSDLLGDFHELMDSFAEVFTAPRELRDFYYNISSRLKLTAEIMMEGEYGW